MRSGRRWRAAIAALVAAVAVAAIASTVASLWTGGRNVQTVRMWTFLNPEGSSPREVALARIIRDFEAKNPDVAIVVEPQVWDQMSPKFLVSHSAGSAPDVVWIVSDHIGDAIRSGALADLNEAFIDRWPADKRAAFRDVFWDTTEAGGRQYGLFTSRNYVALIYRKDVFAAAGIAPDSIRTWDDLRAAAAKLTVRDAAGNVRRYGFSAQYSVQQSDVSPIMPYMLGAGQEPFRRDGKANFANPAAVAGAEYFVGLIRDGLSPAQAANWTGDDLIEQFASGRVAMIYMGTVRVPSMQGKLGGDKVGVMLLPSGDGRRHSPSLVQGWAVGIWSGSKVKPAAGRFVDYMMAEPGDAIWTRAGRQVPAMKTNLTAMRGFLHQPENAFLLTAAEGVATAGWLPPVAFPIDGYRQAINQAFQRMIVDRVDARTALTDAERSFNRRSGR